MAWNTYGTLSDRAARIQRDAVVSAVLRTKPAHEEWRNVSDAYREYTSQPLPDGIQHVSDRHFRTLLQRLESAKRVERLAFSRGCGGMVSRVRAVRSTGAKL